MEEQLEGENDDWDYDSSGEDYSYDEDSDGRIVKKKSKFLRYNNTTEVPHIALSMMFRSKNQLVKALKRYGLVTDRASGSLNQKVIECGLYVDNQAALGFCMQQKDQKHPGSKLSLSVMIISVHRT
jgi:hypothetical protein